MNSIEDYINKIITGNNSEVLDNFPDNSVDLILTSPPYDSLRQYDSTDSTTINYINLIPKLYRVLKPGGIIVWVIGDETKNGSETGTSMRLALDFMEGGFLLHDTMIYEKNGSPFPSKRNGNRYTQIFEYMFIFSKGKPRVANLICDKRNDWHGFERFGTTTCRNADGTLEVRERTPVKKFSPRNNIFKCKTGKNFSSKDNEAFLHPAIFPEQLAADCIETWTLEGDVVVDIFNGSGTTCKMAKLMNRKYVGIDISENYCTLARERLNKYNVPTFVFDTEHFKNNLHSIYVPFLIKKFNLDARQIQFPGSDQDTFSFKLQETTYSAIEACLYANNNVPLEYQKLSTDKTTLPSGISLIDSNYVILILHTETGEEFYLIENDQLKKIIEGKEYKLDTGLSQEGRIRNSEIGKGDEYIFSLDVIRESFIQLGEIKKSQPDNRLTP